MKKYMSCFWHYSYKKHLVEFHQWSQITDWLSVWDPYSHRICLIMCKLLRLFSEKAVKCSGGLATQCSALWTIVLMFFHLQSAWRWTNLKSPIRVMSQYLSGGTRERVCFVDRVLCWSPSPTALVLKAIVLLIPHILFTLNLSSISQVKESI